MGRLIDADRLEEVFSRNVVGGTYFDLIDNAPTVEAIPKDQYETRLKADLKAILVELQLEVEEQKYRELTEDECGFKFGIHTASNIIQQKIDKLYEVKNV